MCTRVFCCENSTAKVAGRTLDASFLDVPHLWWLPAGQVRKAHPDRDWTWTSKYASLTIAEWQDAAVDGMNDQGLGAHALMYTSAVYEPPDDRPVLSTLRWVNFARDLFGTVAEAVEGLAGMRVTPSLLEGLHLGVHLALEDASGDSAIVEPVNGRMVVHHGHQHQIMTNSPSLDEHLANRSKYRPFGGELPPPGDITSLDRFVRASYFHHYLPEPADNRETVAEVFQVLSTVAKPFGAPYPEGDIYPTRWISAVDLTNLDYYFWSRMSPNMLWLGMHDMAGRPAGVVDLFADGLAGDLEPAMEPGSISD